MANTYQAITLAQLRAIALLYSHEIDEASGHWNNVLNALINDGVRQMWSEYGGLRDTKIVSTAIGTQVYDLGQGVTYIEQVIMQNSALQPMSFRSVGDGNTGNCRPNGYFPYMTTASGQPSLALWTMPGPADAVYPLTCFILRSPKDMIRDTDHPEIPLQWQTGPAYYAALQMSIADKNPAAQGLSAIFHKMSTEMSAWLRKNKDRYPVTGRNSRY